MLPLSSFVNSALSGDTKMRRKSMNFKESRSPQTNFTVLVDMMSAVLVSSIFASATAKLLI